MSLLSSLQQAVTWTMMTETFEYMIYTYAHSVEHIVSSDSSFNSLIQ